MLMDTRKRVYIFSVNMIKFIDKLPRDKSTEIMANQLIRVYFNLHGISRRGIHHKRSNSVIIESVAWKLPIFNKKH